MKNYNLTIIIGCILFLLCTMRVCRFKKDRHINIQRGQLWTHYDDNPFNKTYRDTILILDYQNEYVLYSVKYKSGLIDTQSTIDNWFKPSVFGTKAFYTQLK